MSMNLKDVQFKLDGKVLKGFADKPFQATKFTRQEMRERSPSGVVHMDSMIGKNFTTWFLIRCGLVGVAAAYAFDWAIMSIPV